MTLRFGFSDERFLKVDGEAVCEDRHTFVKSKEWHALGDVSRIVSGCCRLRRANIGSSSS